MKSDLTGPRIYDLHNIPMLIWSKLGCFDNRLQHPGIMRLPFVTFSGVLLTTKDYVCMIKNSLLRFSTKGKSQEASHLKVLYPSGHLFYFSRSCLTPLSIQQAVLLHIPNRSSKDMLPFHNMLPFQILKKNKLMLIVHKYINIFIWLLQIGRMNT